MEREFKKEFLDTNILVYLTLQDFDIEKHQTVTALLNELYENDKQLIISTQILREFYAVVTNGKYLENPLTPEQANMQIDYFKSIFTVCSVDLNVIKELQKIMVDNQIKGQNIHDATIAATMKANKIEKIWTYNKKDFNKFEKINPIKPK
ncbi:MAG: hypothetical protein B6I24_07550 [Bacteroidetes bacterium 4572_128]|nr:MAG: hypothetical protein B6I24_07550 [Bacteroidetes bacterium 4572_128]